MKSENKKPMSRRDFLKVLAAATGGAATIPLLNACAPSFATPAVASATATPVPLATTPPTAAPITLRLWTYDDPGWLKASGDEIKRWSVNHSNVSIKHEHFPGGQLVSVYQAGMAAKNEADIIEMFGSLVYGYAKGKTLAPVPADVMTLSEAQSLFYKAPLDGFVWDGILYGFPHEFNLEVGGALVNKRMFMEAGLTYPPDWKSWDALISDAKKMTKWDGTTMTVSGFDFVNFDGPIFWMLEGILERGGDYFADDKIHMNLNSQQAQDTLQWIVDLALVDKVVDANTFNPTVTDVQDAFFQSRCAIGFRGPWVVPGGRVNYPKFADPWDYVSIPPLYGNQYSFAADSGWGLVVSPNSPNQSQAWEFAKFTCTIPENSRIWNVDSGTVPAMKAVAADPTLLNDENWLGPCLKVIPYGRFLGDFQDHDFICYNVIQPTVISACQGNISVKDAVAKMHKDANDKIDSKLKGG